MVILTPGIVTGEDRALKKNVLNLWILQSLTELSCLALHLGCRFQKREIYEATLCRTWAIESSNVQELEIVLIKVLSSWFCFLLFTIFFTSFPFTNALYFKIKLTYKFTYMNSVFNDSIQETFMCILHLEKEMGTFQETSPVLQFPSFEIHSPSCSKHFFLDFFRIHLLIVPPAMLSAFQYCL